MKRVTIFVATIIVSFLCSHSVVSQSIAPRLKSTLAGHRSQVFYVVFSPGGELLATADRDQTKLWTMAGQLLTTMGGTAPLFSPDGRILLTISNKQVDLWDTATGKLTLTLSGHDDTISTAIFSPDGSQIATAGEAGTVKLWDATTGRTSATLWPVKKLPRYRIISRVKRWGNVVDVQFSPDLKFIITRTLDLTRLWETATGRLLEEFNYFVSVAAFSLDSKWLGLNGAMNQVKLLNLETWETRTTSHVETYFLNQLVFSPDIRTYVTASGYKNYHATLIDISTGRVTTKISLTVKWGFDIISEVQNDADILSFHPGSKFLIGANQKSVKMWDASTGQVVWELSEGRIPAAFSLNGKLLATVGKDKKTILLWETEVPDGRQTQN